MMPSYRGGKLAFFMLCLYLYHLGGYFLTFSYKAFQIGNMIWR